MAAKDLFALAGKITVDNSGAIKNIDEATKAAQQSEGKFEGSFKRIAMAAATYLSATAIWNFGKSMVEAAAEVQATNAQFEAAFKDLSGSAEEAFSRVEASSGTLSERLLTTGTKAFSQFTGAGMESTDALERMEEYLNLATDGAAYYDMSLEEVDERLRSFLRGNTEAGDAIGLFTSESQRNAKANEMYGKSFIKLSEDQKQLVMLDITKSIYDASGATGQAAREADGYANVVGNLKEQWKQFLANIGTPLLEAVIPIIKNIGDLLQPLAEKIKQITQFLVEHKDIILAVAAGIGAMAAAYGAYKLVLMAVNAYETISNTLKALSAGYSALKAGATLKEAAATAVATAAQNGLNIAMLASPITWIVIGIGLLVAAFVLLWKKCEGFRNFWKQMWAKIKDYASQAWKQIKQVWDKVKPYFMAIWNNIKTSAKNAWAAIKLVFQVAWTAIKTIWNNAKAYFQMVWNTIRGIFKVVKSVLSGDFKGAWNAIKGIFSGVGKFFRTIVSNITGAFKGIGGKIADYFKGVGTRIKNNITGGLGKVGSKIKGLLGFRTGGVFTGESAIRVAEYPNATTNPEIVTPQNIMRGTFEDTLNDYAYKLQSNGGSSAKTEALLEAILNALGQQKVVLSTGELVGAITPRIDKSLGERSQKKERGRV